MNNKCFLSLFILWLSGYCIFASAQQTYNSALLAEMSEQLVSYGWQLDGSLRQRVDKLTSTVDVIATVDEDHIVSHIGFALPMTDALGSFAKIPTICFFERYLLQLMLIPNDLEISAKMKIESVTIHSDICTGNTRQVIRQALRDMTPATSVVVDQQNRKYTISCLKDGKVLLSIAFPARYDLIMGLSKPEAEDAFSSLLARTDTTLNDTELPDIDYMEKNDKGLYTIDEGWYITEKLQSTSYFKADDAGKVSPVFDDKFRIESVYTLFNFPASFGIQAHVKQRAYHGNRSFDLPLAQLLKCMRDEGCILYTGITDISQEGFSGTIFAVNQSMGFQHQLRFKIKPQLFQKVNTSKSIDITMYNYIPIHNYKGK